MVLSGFPLRTSEGNGETRKAAQKEWRIAPADGFITGIFPDKDAEILYENGYRSTDGEKIKNEFPVEDRLNGVVEALKELEESEDE